MKASEYMRKIAEEIGKTAAGVSDQKADRLADRILRSKKVFVAGAGRSGLMLRAFAMRLMHMGFESHVVGETLTPAVEEGDLLVIGSGSGETESLLVMAKKAKQIGAHLVLITIFSQSSIGVYADEVITIPATTAKVLEKAGVDSIQPKGSLFEQALLIFCETIILMLLKKMKIDFAKLMQRHANLE